MGGRPNGQCAIGERTRRLGTRGKEPSNFRNQKPKPRIRLSLRTKPKAIAIRFYQLLSGYTMVAPFSKKSGDGSSPTSASGMMREDRAGNTSSRSARGRRGRSAGCGRRLETPRGKERPRHRFSVRTAKARQSTTVRELLGNKAYTETVLSFPGEMDEGSWMQNRSEFFAFRGFFMFRGCLMAYGFFKGYSF